MRSAGVAAVGALLEDGPSTDSLQEMNALLSAGLLSIIQRRSGFRLEVGDPKEDVNRLHLSEDPDGDKPSANLMPWASKHEHWQGEVDTARIFAQFTQSPSAMFKELHFVRRDSAETEGSADPHPDVPAP